MYGFFLIEVELKIQFFTTFTKSVKHFSGSRIRIFVKQGCTSGDQQNGVDPNGSGSATKDNALVRNTRRRAALSERYL
jgi:hypothetical protein